MRNIECYLAGKVLKRDICGLQQGELDPEREKSSLEWSLSLERQEEVTVSRKCKGHPKEITNGS